MGNPSFRKFGDGQGLVVGIVATLCVCRLLSKMILCFIIVDTCYDTLCMGVGRDHLALPSYYRFDANTGPEIGSRRSVNLI